MDVAMGVCPNCGTPRPADRKNGAEKHAINGQQVALGFVATLLLGIIPLGLLALVVGGIGSSGAGFILMYGGFGPFALVLGLGVAIIVFGLTLKGDDITKSHALGSVIFVMSFASFVGYSINRSKAEIALRAADLAQQESLKPDVLKYICEVPIKNELVKKEEIRFDVDAKNNNSSMRLENRKDEYKFFKSTAIGQIYYLEGAHLNVRIDRKSGDINLNFLNGVTQSGVCAPNRERV